MKHSKGEWKSTFTSTKERGVRNPGGFICFLPKPSHYSGQDERYERELKETEANAKLIASAPEMLATLKEVDDYWLTLSSKTVGEVPDKHHDLVRQAIKNAEK